MLGCFMYNSGTELFLYLYFSSLFICVHWLNHRVQKKTNENNFYINHNCVFNIGCIIISCYLYQHFDNNFSLQNIWSLLIFLWWKNRHIFQIITKNMVLFFIIITIWVCFFCNKEKSICYCINCWRQLCNGEQIDKRYRASCRHHHIIHPLNLLILDCYWWIT